MVGKICNLIKIPKISDKLSKERSLKYKKYSVAYFEELIIAYQLESRLALNYRERFLVSSEQLQQALEMYCKNDMVNHFLVTDLSMLDRK